MLVEKVVQNNFNDIIFSHICYHFIGYALSVLKKEHLLILAAKALISLFTKDISENRQYAPLDARITIAIKSRLLGILVELLELTDETIYPSILNTVKILVKRSDEACKLPDYEY